MGGRPVDLKTLTEINAPSGHEQPIRRALLAELKEKGFAPTIDRMGNIIVVKEGNGPAPRKQSITNPKQALWGPAESPLLQ